MHSLSQLFHRPLKTLLGILLSLLACAIICVCLGQYIASVQTQTYVENNYTTVGLLTSKYMKEEILDEEGNTIGVSYLSEQPMIVRNFLEEQLSPEKHSFVKAVQQNLLTSAYIDGVAPLNHYGLEVKPVYVDADATSILDMAPYTYAMLVIKVNEVGELRPFIDYETYIPIDVSAYGYAIDLTGTVLEAPSLQEGYFDPAGRTARITVRFASQEEAQAAALEIGQTYLVCGTDYQDLDAQLQRDIAQKSEIEVTQVDWANVQWMTEEEIAKFPFDCVAMYMNEDGSGLYLSEAEARMIGSCSLTVCTDPLLYLGEAGEAELEFSFGGMSAAEYRALFQDSHMVLLECSADDFLAQTEDPFWQEWLNTANINDHSFPVLAVDSLNAVSQFATQDAVLAEGRAFTQAEVEMGAKLCVISESLAAANGLSVGDSISLQFYERDRDLRNNQELLKQANPDPAYYSPELGFSGEEEAYEIIGFYRQSNQWAGGTYCFTPNTIFVPKTAASGMGIGICGGIYTSVILENGTISQLEQLAADNGLEGLFLCYDQGYSQVMESLKGYYEVGQVVLHVGVALWLGVVLLFFFLFPCQLRPDLTRMWELGAPAKALRRHVLASGMGILLPGTVLGCIAAALLFDRMTSYIASAAKAEVALEMTAGTLGVVAVAQMLGVLLLIWLLACLLTASAKRGNRRR